MTGKRKTKKITSEKVTEKTASAGVVIDGSKLDTLGESVAELFSRVAKVEKMFEALTSSAPIEPAETETIDMRDYEVKEEDTAMSVIAKKVYGNAGLFNRIAAHNYERYPELRENANEVKEGWRLRIPPAP